ncbi:MAG: glucokinase [Spirochaetes bacterium]|nr:glucokinase [Spirochaetota bacterium]
MRTKRTSYDIVVLSGDIGGTNTNLALVGKKGGTVSILCDRHYRTREVASLSEPLTSFLADAAIEHPSFPPEVCCMSGAGPVVGNRISLTNAPWDIDGDAVKAEFGLPTIVINDFSAISYGVMLLDASDPEQLSALPHTDGSLPDPLPGGVKAVVGAGTGLGVGYVVKHGDRIRAYPSEGGHASLPVFDGESRRFSSWLETKFGFAPGAEAGVSGQGIANAFAYFAETRAAELTPDSRAIIELPEADRPARIACQAADDSTCARSLDLFIHLYARFAADATAMFLPSGGVFLAGGIASKNEKRFLAGNRFMGMFERSYREHIRSILVRTPVYIVKDYDISLYGAANAAIETFS